MKRIHTVEFEDAPWFPGWLRTCMTNQIVVIARWLGVPSVLGSLVSKAAREHDFDAIVDLGSGAGGVMPEVLATLRSQPETAELRLTLTDLHPNLDAQEFHNDPARPEVRYERAPVDATDLASAPAGLKTMVNCFHHMRPEQARAILQSARDARQPLLIYEMGTHMPAAVWLLSMPIALPLIGLTSMILAPFVRPLTFRQLFFSYVIPLIPLFYAWDGHASPPRIYALEDLDELLEGLDGPDYRWEKGPGPAARGTLGVFLLGLPVGQDRDRDRDGASDPSP